jgi:hypothetical protein
MALFQKGSGAGYILVAQLLLGLVIVVARAYYPTSPRAALVAIYLLFLGILWFSLKGLKALWKR